MSGLDTRYIPSKYFQEGVLDKITGEPLSGGVVTFYKDSDRITKKAVFQISGTPPNYIYTALPNPMTLSAIGTFQDASNNDIIPYFYPYDANGNLELYYITVESAGATFQFSREGVPNLGSGEIAETENPINYISNGQFLLHHNITEAEYAGIVAHKIVTPVTTIAEGGWTFERPTTSTADDFVRFERIGSFTTTPTTSPRYSLRVNSSVPDITDSFKDLRLKFKDVNKFASTSRFFTLYFEAKSNSGSSAQVVVKLIKNFGTGAASPETETTLQAITLDTTYTAFDIPFVFGTNDGKTLGPNNDDFLQLVISFPPALIFDINLDNFFLTDGNIQITRFPDIPEENTVRNSLAGQPPIPDYDGKDLYLPVRLGENGFEYDTDVIGTYVLKSDDLLSKGELWCFEHKYLVDDYSDDKIPYRRLYEKWSSMSSVGLSIYGPGKDEMYFVPEKVIDQSWTTTNVNYDLPTGWQSFTAGVTANLVAIEFRLGSPSAATTITMKIYAGEGLGGQLLSTTLNYRVPQGTVMYINLAKSVPIISGQKYTFKYQAPGSPFFIQVNSPGGYPGGSFEGSNDDMWFKTYVEGAVANHDLKSTTPGAVTPAADGTITPTGFTFTPVQPDPYIIDIWPTVASIMTAGAYFTYNTTDNRKYIVWYEISGSGTQPAESADVYLKVAILSTDADTVVANKTAYVINGYSLGIPEWSGYFIRITDHQSGNDLDVGARLDRGDGTALDAVGTVQTQSNGSGGTTTKNRYANIAIKY